MKKFKKMRSDISHYLAVLKKVLGVVKVTENRRQVLLSIHKKCNKGCFDAVPSQDKFTSLQTDLLFVIQKFEVALVLDTSLTVTELCFALDLVNSAMKLHTDYLRVYHQYNGKYCYQK